MNNFRGNHRTAKAVIFGLTIGLTSAFASVSHVGVMGNNGHASHRNSTATDRVCVLSPTFSECYDSVDQIPADERPSNLSHPTTVGAVVGVLKTSW